MGCHTLLRPEARFCPSCGALVSVGLPEGTLIDERFEIERQLGQGAFGVVYQALDKRSGSPVAIKILHRVASGSDGAKAKAELDREIQAGKRLCHPLIAALIHSGVYRGCGYIATELVLGRTLSARLAEGPLPIDDAVPLVKNLLDALSHAHQQGIIHRDIKPSNIIIGQEGLAHLVDFGVAKILETLTGAESQSAFRGTPAYMSPEQIAGRRIDARSDLFSLGLVCFEMLSGRRAVEGGMGEVVFQIMERPLPDVAGIPPALLSWLQHACRKNPGDRFPSAAAMSRALDEAVEGDTEVLTASHGRESGAITAKMSLPPMPARKRFPVVVLLALLGALFGLAGGVSVTYVILHRAVERRNGGEVPAASPSATKGEEGIAARSSLPSSDDGAGSRHRESPPSPPAASGLFRPDR